MLRAFDAFSEFLTQVDECITQKDLNAVKGCVAKLQSQLPASTSFSELFIHNAFSNPNTFRIALLRRTINSGSLEIFKYFTQELEIDIKDCLSPLLFTSIRDSHDIADFILQQTIVLSAQEVSALYGSAFAHNNEKYKAIFWNKLAGFLPETEDKDAFKRDLDAQLIQSNISDQIVKSQNILAHDMANMTRYAAQLEGIIATLPASAWTDLLKRISTSAKKMDQQFQALRKDPVIEKAHLEMLVVLYRNQMTSPNMDSNTVLSIFDILAKMAKTVAPSEQVERLRSLRMVEKLDALLTDEFLSLTDNLQTKDFEKFKKAWEALEQKPQFWTDAGKTYADFSSTPLEASQLSLVESAIENANFPLYEFLASKLPDFKNAIQIIAFLKGARLNRADLVNAVLLEPETSLELLLPAYMMAIVNDHNELAENIRKHLPDRAKATALRLTPELKEFANSQLTTQSDHFIEINSSALSKLNELKNSLIQKQAIENFLADINKLVSLFESLNEQMIHSKTVDSSKKSMVEMVFLRLLASVEQSVDLYPESKIMSEIRDILNNQELLDPSNMMSQIPPKLLEEILREAHEDAIAPVTSEEFGLYHEIKKKYGQKFAAMCDLDVDSIPEVIDPEQNEEFSQNVVSYASIDEDDNNFDVEDIDSAEGFNGEGDLDVADLDDNEELDVAENPDANENPDPNEDDAAAEVDADDNHEIDDAPSTSLPLSALVCFPILKDLENYLVESFSKDNLSQTYDPALSQDELEKYHSNIFHTAWRYIFCKPNPWLFPDSKWAKNGASEIHDEDYERLAYFWLAVSDEETQPIQGFTLEGRKAFFAKMLASFGREYNDDNVKGDDPTCGLAVKKRQSQLLIGHPIIEEVKDLKPEYILELMKQYFIAQNELGKTLFNDLSTLSLKELKQLNDAITSWITNCGEVDRIDSLILNIINLDLDSLIEANIQFADQIEAEFGSDRLSKFKVTYQGESYDNCDNFVENVSINLVKFYSAEIYQHVQGLITKLEAKDQSSPPIVSSFEEHKKRKRAEHPDQAKQEDSSDSHEEVKKSKKQGVVIKP